MSDTTFEDGSDLGTAACEAVAQLMKLSGIEAEVQLVETEERIRVEVYPADEDDSTLLVGRQGRTLSAYQFLVNRMINRSPDYRKPISIDVSGYVEQRRDRLGVLGGRLAKTVIENELEVSVISMNPADRRAVHLTVLDTEGANSFSEGEGIARHLVVTMS